MELNKYMVSLVKDIQKVIKIKTVQDTPVEGGPFGKGNKECLETVLKMCKDMGFKVKNLDGYCGYAEVGSGDELVGIIGHLDVVPEGEGWEYPPYSAKIVNEEIWGRGTWDDKGPTIISIYAIKALMDSGFKFNKRVRLIFGCNEESGSLCMEHYLKVDEPISYGVSPDANFPVIFGEKTINNIFLEGTAKNNGKVKLTYLDGGIVINAVPDKCNFKLECEDKENVKTSIKNALDSLNIKFEVKEQGNELSYLVFGKACHGSIPQYGINAISYAIKALANVVDNDFVKFYDKYIGLSVNGSNIGCYACDEYGDLAFNVGIVHYENDEFVIKVNSRLPFNTNNEKMFEQISETIKNEKYVKAVFKGGSTGFIMDKESLMIKSLVKAYQEVTGDTKSEPICCAGGTYAREFKNCVAFGPEMEGYDGQFIHQPNERIPLKAVEDLLKIYTKAYADLIEKVSFK